MLGIPLILQPIIDQDEPTGDRFDNQFQLPGRLATVSRIADI